ncbi:MAG: YihY family inner membrane protein [Thermoanaerobaculales bacterium]
MRVIKHLRRLDLRALPWWERALVRPIQFVQALLGQMHRDTVIIRASGLAYSSLLAAVPLVVVGFAMFSAFGAFDDIKMKVQDLLFSQFLPTSQDEIVTYLNQFADGANKLGLLGFLFFIFAAILLLDNIESNFNNIWHVTTRRRFIAKITSYTSVLVFGVLFLGASLTISARIKAMLFTGALIDPTTLGRLGTWFFPLLFTFLAFLLMYLVIPFTRVQWRSATVGALVGSVFWELGKNIFANSVGQSVRYSTIYGSLAVVPIFLVWLYITWIIVLLGLEVAYTHQHFAALVRSRAADCHDGGDSVSIALQIYLLIAQRFCRGLAPPTPDELARRFLVATGVVDNHLDRLEARGLARRVTASSGCEGVVPARSLDEVLIRDVIQAFIQTGEEEHRRRPIELAVEEILDDFRSAGFEAVGETTVRELVDRLHAHASDNPP